MKQINTLLTDLHFIVPADRLEGVGATNEELPLTSSGKYPHVVLAVLL